jgi:small subunit ribosomal protein S4e
MSHLKRQAIPKTWPIPRKGNKFVVESGEKGIPLLIVLRDILEIARNRREVKKALIKKDILVCGKNAKEEKKNLFLNDTISLVPSKKAFRIIFSDKGKYNVEEISEKESFEKISKIIGKKVLRGKKTQINLFDGRNYLVDEKCNVNDSAKIDFKKNKVIKFIDLKEKSKVIVIGGKHSGKKGTIEKIDEDKKIAEVNLGEEKINVLNEDLMAVE